MNDSHNTRLNFAQKKPPSILEGPRLNVPTKLVVFYPTLSAQKQGLQV